MALYQPTNIIPSSYTKGTVDAVNDKMEISWQVNGNSAMTAFQIDFYLNDAKSTYVTTTGRLTDNIPTGGFYGTDRFGKPQFFTWNANDTWNNFNSGFTNGNEYKYKITQWYKGGSVYTIQPTAWGVERSCFSLVDSNGKTIFISFARPALPPLGTTLTYNLETKQLVLNATSGDLNLASTQSETQPANATYLGVAVNDIAVEQTSFSSFITRTVPALTLQQTDENYLNPIAFLNTIATSKGYFHADYIQEQNDPIRWIRWQIATATKNTNNAYSVVDILVDTGDVYTPTLNFEFNGFFNGNSYAIRCLGESESGQIAELQGAENGWIFFDVSYTQSTYLGTFTAQCVNKENATLLEWEEVESISGNYTPPEGSEEQYSFENDNSVVLPANSSMTWSKQSSKDMNFPAPWTATWKGRIVQTPPELTGFSPLQNLTVGLGFLLKYSPDGKLLLYNDQNNRQILVYNVTETALTLKGYLLSNGTIVTTPTEYSTGFITDMVFSNNNFFAVSTTGGLFLHRYNNENFSLLNSNTASGSSLVFSPNESILVHGGSRIIGTTVYSITNNTLNPLYTLQRSGVEIRKNISAVDFNKDGTIMCMCSNETLLGQQNTYAWVFDVDGNQITHREDLSIDRACYNLAFNKGASPNMLITVSEPDGYIQYSVTQNGMRLIGNVVRSPYQYQGTQRSISFSPDGNNLLLGGSNEVALYSCKDNIIIYDDNILSPNSQYGAWDNAMAIDWNPKMNQIAIHNQLINSDSFNQIFTADYSEPTYGAQGKLYELQGNNLSLTATNNTLTLNEGTNNLASFTYPVTANSTAIIITPTTARAYFYSGSTLISQSSTPITYTQQPITSVQIFGGDNGATVESVSVFDNREKQFNIANYENPDFETSWNDPNYDLYMTANFNGNIQGGTGNAEGSGFQVFRREVGGNVLTPIANVNALTTSLKDYGIRSRKAYEYLLGVYDSNNAFMGLVTAQNTIATNFKNYSLLVCDYDQDKDEYHVRKQYLFALNLSAGSVGNNNSPTVNANFTRYPTRMPSTQNYASGTLQGLIGAIYTVPALIEQIGNYKWTAKPSTMDYFDSVDLEQELYDLSTAPYQLFLRDMKGRLRMVATNGAIMMTTNIKQKQQSISISFPWVEIGDASNVTIIQTPDDYGWNNDNQVLDVSLDVDIETGELSATYPYPYNGTKFYLTGVNKETLTAKTPLGVTLAQFDLSETATQPKDGELTATVKVNSENDN